MNEEVLDAIAYFQAMTLSNVVMLEALIISHPNQDALRAAWDRASAPRLASSETERSATGRTVSVYETELLVKWGEKLERLRNSP